MRIRQCLPFAVLMLAACQREEQPEAPTAAESAQLNEAEEMLDELANKEGAAPGSTAPSNNSD